MAGIDGHSGESVQGFSFQSGREEVFLASPNEAILLRTMVGFGLARHRSIDFYQMVLLQ